MTLPEEFKDKTRKTILALREALGGIRGSRATPALIENVAVECYGSKTPLKQIGSIQVAPPRELVVQVWDKSIIPAVTKALESASLGLSITGDAASIRAFLPEMSRERREEMARHVRKETEQYRIQVRALRDETNKKIEEEAKMRAVSEDQKFALRKLVQEETERANAEIEQILEAKIREINE